MKKELLKEIELTLYRFLDTVDCYKSFDTSRAKCNDYMLAVNVIELCDKEMDYHLRRLEKLIAQFLPENDYSALYNNRLIKFLNLSPSTVCRWKSHTTLGIHEYNLKLKGFDKYSSEYHCLIQAFRNIEGTSTFHGAGYDTRKDEFYIVYYLG